MQDLEGFKQLDNIIQGANFVPTSSIVDEDSKVMNSLNILEYVTPRDIDTEGTNHLNIRSKVRYLAAIFPEANITELTQKIHALINNRNLDIDEVRLILQGRRLNNPQKMTNEVPVTIIQGIGKCLRDGLSLRATAREMRVSYDTVEAIERYLGLHKKHEDDMKNDAVEAARLNVSVRKFATQHGISRSKAHRLLIGGKEVLRELGEVK